MQRTHSISEKRSQVWWLHRDGRRPHVLAEFEPRLHSRSQAPRGAPASGYHQSLERGAVRIAGGGRAINRSRMAPRFGMVSGAWQEIHACRVPRVQLAQHEIGFAVESNPAIERAIPVDAVSA